MEKESDRTISSVLMAVLLLLGGIVTLASGMGYLDDPDIHIAVAYFDVVAGILLLIGCVCQIIGERPILWKICFASLVMSIVAGVGMFTVTIIGGAIIIAISAVMILWMHTTGNRRWFKI